MTTTEMRWTIFRRKDTGRYVLSYVPPGGDWRRPTQVTAPKEIRAKKAAREWAASRVAELEANGGRRTERRRSGPTLREAHERLMEIRSRHPDVKRGTIANNWTHLRAQILAKFEPKDEDEARELRAADLADVPMTAVDVARARAWVRLVRARVSPNHCRNCFSTARALWDLAIGESIVRTANPFRNQLVTSEVPKARSLHQLAGGIDAITLSIAIVQKLADAPDDVVPLERRVRYLAGVVSGFDEGELAGLQWKRIVRPPPISGRPAYLEMRQQLALRGADGFATVAPPKTENRLRDVPLHLALDRALVTWRDAWERLVCRQPGPEDFIFVWPDGRPQRHKARAELLRQDLRALNARELAEGREELLPEARIALITFKALRRTFSSALKAAGVEPEDRGRLMGHAGASVTTRNYTDFELAYLAEKIGRIPLLWRSVHTSVHTDGGGAQNCGESRPQLSTTKGESLEARIGFEPTYDGFAIGSALCGRDSDGRATPHDPSETRHSGIGTGPGNGLAERRPAQPAQHEPPTQQGRPGPVRARAPRGAVGVRVEVDGRELARTEVEPGEPLEDVEARLRLAVGRRGGLR